MYPNPSSQLTRINLEVQHDDQLSVDLISPLGQRVQHIFAGRVSAGNKVEAEINTAELPSGVYQVQLRGTRSRQTYKLMVIH